jgi:hypothetical protein
VCEAGADEKAAINEKVKSIKCTYGNVDGRQIKLKMNGNTLEATFDWDTVNIYSDSKEWLMNNL